MLPNTKEVAKYDVKIESKLLPKKKRLSISVSNTKEVKFNILEPASDTKKFKTNVLFMDEAIDEWEIDKSFPIGDVEVKCEKEICFIKVQSKTIEATFKSAEDAFSFYTFIEKFQQHLKDGDSDKPHEKRSEMSQLPATQEEETTLLIEIVSARDLVGSHFSTIKVDPYVLVTLNGKKVHRSKHIENEMSPIWTVLTDSLFIFEVTSSNKHEKCMFSIYDFNSLRSDNNLGHVSISIQDLVNANGERLCYRLLPPAWAKERFKRFSTFVSFL